MSSNDCKLEYSSLLIILVYSDAQLTSRTVCLSLGFQNCHNIMQIKTKSCRNGTLVYKVDELTACHLNYCSKIINYGKWSTSIIIIFVQ